MSTSYINFSSIDFTGMNSVSSYATSLTPFTFIPDLPSNTGTRVVWNFGDGTISRSFSAKKYYEYPGTYNVELVVYNCDNNADISTFTKKLSVFDFLPYTFSIDGPASPLEIPIGTATGPFVFQVTYPPYQTETPIYYSVSGSGSYNFWDINDQKYGHLENFYTILDTQYNYSLSAYQYIPSPTIVPSTTAVYAKIDAASIVECLSSVVGSSLVGRRGTKTIYLKDDVIRDLIYVKFFFDKSQTYIPEYKSNRGYINNLGLTLSAKVIDNPGAELSITSTGVDGEGVEIDSFKIHPIKYFNTKIPFVVKIKDSNWFSVKNYPKIEVTDLTFSVTGVGDIVVDYENGVPLLDEYGNAILANGVSYTLFPPISGTWNELMISTELGEDLTNELDFYITTDGTSLEACQVQHHYAVCGTPQYYIFSLNETLSSQNSGGAFRGYIYFPKLSEVNMIQNAKITVSGTFVSDTLSSYLLSAESNYFNLYTSGEYDMYKKYEDFDAEQTLKDLRFQETMLDKERLFGEFLGDILGDEHSNYHTIGKKLYEKICSFVQNTQDVEVCENRFLHSLATFLGYNDSNEEHYNYPLKVQRWMDLFSINKSKLFGVANNFAQNLDVRGRTTKLEFGTNLGEQLNVLTYEVNCNNPIVALEKFSNSYTLLNTYQPISVVNSTTYKLSGYSSDWGWPLVLPSTMSIYDMDKYYLFFEYIPGYENTILGSVLDFENSQTTIPITTGVNELGVLNGIYENVILNTLYDSLSLIN